MKKLLPLFIFIFAFSVFGQEQFTKGMTVVPKFTFSALEFDKIKVWSFRSQYSAIISKSSDQSLSINNKTEWNKKFPIIHEFQIKEFEISKKKPTRVLLVSGTRLEADDSRMQGTQIEIMIPVDLDAQSILNALLYKGNKETFLSSEYFKSIEKTLLSSIFLYKMSAIPFETQRQLMKDVNYQSGIYSLTLFKDQDYFEVNFSDDVVYNTIQVTQPERVSRQTASALNKIRDVYRRTGKIPEVYGIEVRTKIYSRDFLREKFESPHEEKFEMYVPFDLIQKYVDAEITNQEIVDGSIILLNKNRTKVNLTVQ